VVILDRFVISFFSKDGREGFPEFTKNGSPVLRIKDTGPIESCYGLHMGQATKACFRDELQFRKIQ
jgi:hypothetical protein